MFRHLESKITHCPMFCPLQPTTKLFIDGKFVESKTTEWIDIHNPVSEVVSAYMLAITVQQGSVPLFKHLVKGEGTYIS